MSRSRPASEPSHTPGHQHISAAPGESAPFHFETTWKVPAAPHHVWQVLSDLSSWPGWWPGVRRAEMSDDGLRCNLVVQSPLGYRLRFTLRLVEKHAPRGAGFSATGDLRGIGTVRMKPEGEHTIVSIMWCVVTRRRLLSKLRPATVWAHTAVMAAGQKGLNRICGGHVTLPIRRTAG